MRLAVIFHRLGPYHWARLNAAATAFDILAVEQSAETTEYLWDKVEGVGAFPRETLFSSTEKRQRPREIAARLATVLERFGPDAVAVPGWSTPAALAALAWCRRSQVPAIVFSESTALDSTRSGYKEWLKKRVVSLCASSLVGGSRHRAYIEQLGMPNDKIFLGYDAVDNEHFRIGAAEARTDARQLRSKLELPEHYFLASSRFLPQKNLPALLDAYGAYRQSVGSQQAWSLVLLGEGPMRQKIVRKRDELGLCNALILPGFKQYNELPAFYGLASVFVHASTSEPWGLVVNEAMAAGLPVIVSERCGCAADLVVPGQNGFVFNPNDTAGLSALLQELASMGGHDLNAMGLASHEIISYWGLERFADGLQGAVAEACANGSAPSGNWLDRLCVQLLAAR